MQFLCDAVKDRELRLGVCALLAGAILSSWIPNSGQPIPKQETTVELIQCSQETERQGERDEIAKLLDDQARCWNAGDIEGFMETYWKSDEMTFSSGGRLVKGWQSALDRYRKNYPPESMGQLNFDIVDMQFLGTDSALLLGDFHLKCGDQKSDGNFTLVLRKLPEGWRIIHDHSSALEESDGKPIEGSSAGSHSHSGAG